MRHLNTFLVLSILLCSFQINGQDSNTVSYSLFLEKSGFGISLDTKVDEGVFKEGESFIIPEAILPSAPIDFSIYQELYDALAGGKFGIDYGALNNDIMMKIFIRNLETNGGKYVNLGETKDTLFSYFEIRIWELPDSIYYPEEASFYFNEGYFARFALPKSQALLNFLSVVGINHQDSLGFAFLENGTTGTDDWNGFGIETIDSPDTVKFKAIHLSRIGGGRRGIAKNVTPTSVKIKELEGIPANFNLLQNYPNPFNPSTKISYSIKSGADVSLKIYNVLGKHIFTLVEKHQSAGNYEIEFSAEDLANDLPSGIYFYTLSNRGATITKKMILMK